MPAKIIRIEDYINSASEEESKKSTPICPKYLSKPAKKIWDETVDILLDQKIISSLDSSYLARYCSMYDEFIKLDRKIKEHGITQKTPNGYEQVTGTYTAWRDISKQLATFENKLGLNPASRKQMKIDDDKEYELEF